MIGHLFLAWMIVQAAGSIVLLGWWVISESR